MNARIFYCNVNYRCNQRCLFCFSHHTSNVGLYRKDISCVDFEKALKKHQVNEDDKIVFNGGEPLLHPEIMTLLKQASSTGARIVIFSNGTLLADMSFAREIVSLGIGRLVIPIHGFASVHDRITGGIGSYDSVVKGIHNVISLGGSNVLELKFILTNLLAESNFDPLDLFACEFPSLVANSIMMTGQVNTQVAERNAFLLEYTPRFCKYVERMIRYAVERCPVKIVDLDFCRFSNGFQHWLMRKRFATETHAIDFYAMDGETKDFNTYKFESRREQRCVACHLRPFCMRVLEGYRALQLNKDRASIVLEASCS